VGAVQSVGKLGGRGGSRLPACLPACLLRHHEVDLRGGRNRGAAQGGSKHPVDCEAASRQAGKEASLNQQATSVCQPLRGWQTQAGPWPLPPSLTCPPDRLMGNAIASTRNDTTRNSCSPNRRMVLQGAGMEGAGVLTGSKQGWMDGGEESTGIHCG